MARKAFTSGETVEIIAISGGSYWEEARYENAIGDGTGASAWHRVTRTLTGRSQKVPSRRIRKLKRRGQ